MIQTKTPLYILYYIDFNNGRLVKDSTIYDTEIISSRDLESSSQQNMIEISVPKYRNAMSGEMQPTESRWIDIMNNQRSGNKLYYIVSSSSYNSTEYLTDPIYTNTLRTEEGNKEDEYLAYRPYFSGHLTKIDSLSTKDTITLTFSGFDWYYSKKLMDPNRTKLYSGGDDYYEYANFYYNYDPTGEIKLGSYDAPTRIPMLTNNLNPDTQRSDVFYRQDSTTLQCKREGLHHLKFYINCQHNEAYSSGVTMNVYRDPNIRENEMLDSEGNPIDRILIASKSITLEGGSTANQNITIDLTDDTMYDMPSMDLVWQRTGNHYHKVWVEAYSTAGSDKSVTYTSASLWASTSCYSLDHDQIYPALAYEPAYDFFNAQVFVQSFVDSMPEQIMDSGKIHNDVNYDASNTHHFRDPIVITDGATRRMYAKANSYSMPKFNLNKFTTTTKAAIDSILSQVEVMPNWGTFLYSNGKISMDVASADSEDIPIYTDYVNTDIIYNVRDDYYNHYYHYFGSSSDKPNNHYHTVSHTMTEYLNPNGKVQKDPVTMMTAFRYQKDEEEDKNKTDEDLWNQMGVENQEKHEQYVRNKYTYVYYPEKDFDLRVRIGDYFVSTPESPVQLRRRITGISRVCEGGIIKWIYKMEGDE